MDQLLEQASGFSCIPLILPGILGFVRYLAVCPFLVALAVHCICGGDLSSNDVAAITSMGVLPTFVIVLIRHAVFGQGANYSKDRGVALAMWWTFCAYLAVALVILLLAVVRWVIGKSRIPRNSSGRNKAE